MSTGKSRLIGRLSSLASPRFDFLYSERKWNLIGEKKWMLDAVVDVKVLRQSFWEGNARGVFRILQVFWVKRRFSASTGLESPQIQRKSGENDFFWDWEQISAIFWFPEALKGSWSGEERRNYFCWTWIKNFYSANGTFHFIPSPSWQSDHKIDTFSVVFVQANMINDRATNMSSIIR